MKTPAKIIKLPTAQINEWVERCKKGDRIAQTHIYQRYAPVILAITRRYTGQTEDAEDVMMETFMSVFTKIQDYSGKGSFEGWMRRIAVTQSLMFLRKKRIRWTEMTENQDIADPKTVLDQIYEYEILGLLDHLPAGYRTIFNLYVIEGYKHREIADMLEISINTSKSQLILAKKRMAELIQKKNQDERTQGR